MKVFTIYGRGYRLGHVTKPMCIISLFLCSQNLAHGVWFQITQHFFEKIGFNFEN